MNDPSQYNPKNPDLFRQVELDTPVPPSLNIVQITPGQSILKDGDFASKNFRSGQVGFRIQENGDVEFGSGYFRGDITGASGTFSGTITATTGAIGGFDIGSDYIRDVANTMGMASTVSGGDDVRFWAGDTYANRATADFRVTEAGEVTATNITITGGSIGGTTTIGIANVNIAARGWTQTSVFSVTDADTVAWASGTFTSADGTAYSIGAGNTGNMAAATYIYLDIAVSTIAYQTTTTASTAVGAGKVLVAKAQNNTTEATFFVFGGIGGTNIDGTSIVPLSITSNELGAASVISSKSNLALRGWTQTSTFSVTDADTIAWGAGTFTASDGTAYSIGASNTGNMSAKTFIYLDIAVSTTAYQTTTTATTAVGDGKVLIAIAQNGTTEANYILLNSNSLNIDASNIVTGSITANEIAASTITGGKIAATTITASNIVSGTITGTQIAATTITASNIASGTITTTQIAAGTIVASDIAANTITANELSTSITYAGAIVIDTAGLIRSGQTAFRTGTGWWIGNDGGTPKLSIGVGTTGSEMFWDGTNLQATNMRVVQLMTAGESFTGGTAPQPAFIGDDTSTEIRTADSTGTETIIDLTKRVALKYTPSSNITINKISVRCFKDGGGTPMESDVIVSVQADSAGQPSGTDLSSATITNSSIGTSESLVTSPVFTTNVELTSGTPYWMVVRLTTTSETDDLHIDRTTGGSNTTATFDGSTWTVDTTSNIGIGIHVQYVGGQLFKSEADITERAKFHGFVINTVSLGSTVTQLQFTGFSTLSGLSAGSTYYVSDTIGTIGTTPGSTSVEVGKAISSTQLLIKSY